MMVYEMKGSGVPPDVPPRELEGIWPEPPFYYLFYGKDCSPSVSKWLESHAGWELTGEYEIPYEKWQDISAREISLGLFDVLISGASPEKSDRLRILMEPGVVFGSGLHPTTQGCLLAISEIFPVHKIRTAVDFGTGTGILAIACALAGARMTLAIDKNPMALANTRKNARANGVESRLALVRAENMECLGLSADFLVLNVEWPILEKILEAGQWMSAERVVLAGFLHSRLEAVENFARPAFEVKRVMELQGWPTVIFTRM